MSRRRDNFRSIGTPPVDVVLIALVLTASQVYAWPSGQSGPLVGGVIPASFLSLTCWMAVYFLFILYVEFVREPMDWLDVTDSYGLPIGK